MLSLLNASPNFLGSKTAYSLLFVLLNPQEKIFSLLPSQIARDPFDPECDSASATTVLALGSRILFFFVFA